MSRPVPEARLAEVVSLVEKYPNGVTFLDFVLRLKPPCSMRSAERWVSLLVKQGRLIRTGSRRAARYKVPPPVRDPASPQAPVFCSSVARAVHCLVTMPLSDRLYTEYARGYLDRYVPGQTFYLPYETRVEVWKRLSATVCWEDVNRVDQTAAALAWRILALEETLAGPIMRSGVQSGVQSGVSGRRASTEAEIVACLAENASRNDAPDVQLARNIGDVLFSFGVRTPKAPLSWQVLNEVYARVTAQLTPDALGAGGLAGADFAKLPADRPHPVVVRAVPLVLPHTTYYPPMAPMVVQACLEQVIRTALAIPDAIEQSFFLLVHLLYLQPFSRLNTAMALLMMNIPVLAVGGSPVTLSATSPSELIAAIRGVWELTRSDLLAEAYTGFPITKP